MARWRRFAFGGVGCGCASVLALGALGLGGAGVATAAVFAAASRWEDALRTALDTATGGEVTFSGVGLSWSGLVVKDVVVTAEDGAPVLSARKVRVGVTDLDTLRTEQWQLSSLTLDDVVIDVRRRSASPDGFALPRRTLGWLRDGEAGVGLPSVQVPEVRVRGLSASLVTVAGEPPLVATSDDLRVVSVAVVPATGGPSLTFGAVTGDAGLSGRGFAATAKGLSATGAGPWSLDGGWALTGLRVASVDVSADEAKAKAKRGDTAVGLSAKGLGVASVDLVALDLGAVSVERLEATLGTDRVALGALSLDPGPWTAGAVEVPDVRVAGVKATLGGWSGASKALRAWGGLGGVALDRVSVAAVHLGDLDAGATKLGGLVVEGVVVAPDGVSFSGATAAKATVGPASGADLALASGRFVPGDGFVLPATRLAGVSLDVDLYAPQLGLPGLVGALPAGTGFSSLTLTGTTLAVKAGARSGTATVASLEARDVVQAADGFRAAAATVSGISGALTSRTGTLRADLGGAELRDLALAGRTTVGSGSLSNVEVRGSDRVARASRVDLGADGHAVVSGGEAWTSLVGPHAVVVPPVLSEHVPKGLGGAAGRQASWWDIALSDLPWAPKRITGAGTLHLRDDVIGHHVWAIAAETFSLGPFGGPTAAVEAHGTVAGGKFDLVGKATEAGRVTATLTGRGLDADEFESYGTPALAAAGLGVGPGRIALDLELSLTPERLGADGVVGVKNLTLVVEDRKKVGAALLSLKGGRFELADRRVPVKLGCALSEPLCSPVGEIVAAVTSDLIDATTSGLSGGAEGVVDDVKGVLDGVKVPGLGGGKKGEKGEKGGKSR